MAHAYVLGGPGARTVRIDRPSGSDRRARAACPVPNSQTRLRLTRRGRIVLVVLPLVLTGIVLLAAWSALMAPARAAGEHLEGPGTAVTVTVKPGESLWTIAADRVPDQDPRVTVSQIRELNDLSGTRVLPGEQILVPAKR